MNTIIENRTSLSAYYKHPRNIHILNKGARYLQALNSFVCNCIYSETTILLPNIFEQYIISKCTNMDDYCELIHQLVQTLSGFPQTYKNNRTNPPLQKNSDSASRLYHLSHTQVTTLLNFVQKYDIIIMYEKTVKQILHYVLNHTATIEDSITALVTERCNRLYEIYLAVFEWLDKRHLHKKNARILLNELNYIHFSAWNDTDQCYILEKLNNLKEIKALPHREYQIIKKLISKGI